MELEEMLRNGINYSKQYFFVLGVDSSNTDKLAFCLGRVINHKFEVILAKETNDEKGFRTEVENLAKYFNATIFEEKMKQILSDFMYWLVYECTINKPDNNIPKTVDEYLKYLKVKGGNE